MPWIIYGTAWKDAKTTALVGQALEAGYRGFDTANQRKHYHEAALGDALRASKVPRDELWIQTKFTFKAGQDHRLPYDPQAPIAQQVEQSFASSLEHLGGKTLDSYVLHGPSSASGLGPADWEAWDAMSRLQQAGKARQIGVSNITQDQLRELHAKATVKPACVQNRTFTRPAADREVRLFCRTHGITYQGFSLLTAVPHLVNDAGFARLALTYDATPAQVMFAYARQRGMTPLTGTTSRDHMLEDLRSDQLRLAEDVLAALDEATGWTR